MTYCSFCNDYIAFMSFDRFCPDCANLRRVMLINDRKKFLEHIEETFVKYNKKENKTKSIKEATITEKVEERKKRNHN